MATRAERMATNYPSCTADIQGTLIHSNPTAQRILWAWELLEKDQLPASTFHMPSFTCSCQRAGPKKVWGQATEPVPTSHPLPQAHSGVHPRAPAGTQTGRHTNLMATDLLGRVPKRDRCLHARQWSLEIVACWRSFLGTCALLPLAAQGTGMGQGQRT